MPCIGSGISFRLFPAGTGILISTSSLPRNLDMMKKKMFLSAPPEKSYGGSPMIKETDDGTI
jgi:hypothetical protein